MNDLDNEDLESYLDKSPDAARIGKAVEYLVQRHAFSRVLPR